MIYNFTGVDIETTGLDQTKGDEMIEMAFLMYQYDTEKGSVKSLGKYIQRVYPGKAISAKAQAVHHISIDDLIGCPLWEDVAEKAQSVLERTDLLIAHNREFDVPFLAGELERVGLKLPELEVFCTMTNGRFATYDGAVPSLRVLCECFGVNYNVSEAHAAEYDTAAMMKCFFMGLRGGYYQLPEMTMERERRHENYNCNRCG